MSGEAEILAVIATLAAPLRAIALARIGIRRRRGRSDEGDDHVTHTAAVECSQATWLRTFT